MPARMLSIAGLAALLAGCASMPAPVVADGASSAYPAVYAPAPERAAAMTPDQQAKTTAGLVAARAAQVRAVAAAARIDAERDEAERRVMDARRREAEARPAGVEPD